MLAAKQIMLTGNGLVGRSITGRRVDALRASGFTLTTSEAAVPSSHYYRQVTKDRYFSAAAAPSQQAQADPLSVTLYQYQICPFCNTAKAVLAYANIPYKTVEVNPLTKAELKWYVHIGFDGLQHSIFIAFSVDVIVPIPFH